MDTQFALIAMRRIQAVVLLAELRLTHNDTDYERHNFLSSCLSSFLFLLTASSVCIFRARVSWTGLF